MPDRTPDPLPDQTAPVPGAPSSGVGATRAGLGALGVVVGLYGAWLLLSRQDTEQLVSAAVWLGGGVLVHDGLIALAGLAAVAVGGRVLPTAARAPAAIGLVVLGSISLVAVPVLGRFGAREDNPTLLDRDYGTGFAVVVALVVLAVVVASVVRARRDPGLRTEAGPDTGDDPA